MFKRGHTEGQVFRPRIDLGLLSRKALQVARLRTCVAPFLTALTILTTLQPDLTTGAQAAQLHLTTRAQLHLTNIDEENTIIYCSKYNVLYSFMEQPRAGGGTAARAA